MIRLECYIRLYIFKYFILCGGKCIYTDTKQATEKYTCLGGYEDMAINVLKLLQ